MSDDDYIEVTPELVTALKDANARVENLYDQLRAAEAAHRAPRCGECGSSDQPLHKHHPDYSRPKQVITLCVPYHERTHHG